MDSYCTNPMQQLMGTSISCHDLHTCMEILVVILCNLVNEADAVKDNPACMFSFTVIYMV